MTHYNENPGIVRCDVFKPGGKWYETIALDMSDFYHALSPFDAVALAVEKANHYKLGQWNFVVSVPYHHSAYPVMIPDRVSPERVLEDAHRGIEFMKKEGIR